MQAPGNEIMMLGILEEDIPAEEHGIPEGMPQVPEPTGLPIPWYEAQARDVPIGGDGLELQAVWEIEPPDLEEAEVRMQRAMKKLAKAGLITMLVSATGILRSLPGDLSTHDFISKISLFFFLALLALGSGLVVTAVLFLDLPGNLAAARAAESAAAALTAMVMAVVACWMVLGF